MGLFFFIMATLGGFSNVLSAFVIGFIEWGGGAFLLGAYARDRRGQE
jgi:hypothetical protein